MAKRKAADAAKTKPADAGKKDKGGRPAWEPSDVQRGEVRAFTVAGYTEPQIADYFGIDPKTLRKHCRVELDFATMKVIANAAGNVVRLANGIPAEYDAKRNCIRAEIPMSLGPNAFILKTRAKKLGWSERVEVAVTPLPDDLTGLTNEQLEILAAAERLLEQLAAAAPGPGGASKTTH